MDGVAGSGTNLMPTDVAKKSLVRFDREPPNPRRQLERRVTIAHRLSHDCLSAGSSRAVQCRAKSLPRISVALREIRRVSAELSAKGGGTTASPIACLTSTRCAGHARHVGVVLPSVVDGAAVATDEATGLPVQ